MRKIPVSFRLLIALLLPVSTVRSETKAPPLETGPVSLSFQRLPLILENGDISLRNVPTRFHGAGMSEDAEAMCAPVYATSGRELDRTTDINLISVSGITITYKSLAKDGKFKPGEDVDAFIDVSHFKQPENIKLRAPAIVEAIVACMHSSLPWSLGMVNVKIIGAHDASEFSKLVGPLWSPGYMKNDAEKGQDNLPRGQEDFFILRSLHLPLMLPDGGIGIREVPVKYRFEAQHAFIAAYGAPVYAASAREADRKVDSNLISSAKIGVSIEYMKPDGWMTRGAESILVIDLSHFTQPPNLKLEPYDVVQTILTCLRIDIPPASDGKINVRVVGARDPSLFTTLEGPLWRSGYQQPEDK